MSVNAKSKKYFISGIDTNIGKTIVSSILTEALQADYWKPIQAGDLENSDTDKVRSLVSNQKSRFHSNSYALKTAASPHYAAKMDEIRIDLKEITLPKTENHLIIEGAGGLLVPLNANELIIDLIQLLDVELILVVKSYLGSINHTLLSVEAAKRRLIPIKGIIFNGESNAASEEYILNFTQLPFLGRVRTLPELNRAAIQVYAKQFEFLKHD
jgi:dethiobiotin synthetase